MLDDSRSKTNILIDGPDSRIDEIVERLPYYKDKPWLAIQKMSLEKDSLSCKNAFSALCICKESAPIGRGF